MSLRSVRVGVRPCPADDMSECVKTPIEVMSIELQIGRE